MLRPLLFLALIFAASSAWAAERAPLLTDLAYVLGQSHAYRQACQGPGDQYWRGKMQEMLQTEREPELEAPLKAQFNAGFNAVAKTQPSCAASRSAASAVARRGAQISSRLSASQ